MALIALGGFTGAVFRFLCSKWLPTYWGTFFVNVIGSFLIGLCLHLTVHTPMYAFIVIGFLGAFTTFSTFTYETLQLIQQQRYRLAFLQSIGSTMLCFGATLCGYIVI